jgi:hypothetical protein
MFGEKFVEKKTSDVKITSVSYKCKKGA